jgi:hypothetical protein
MQNYKQISGDFDFISSERKTADSVQKGTGGCYDFSIGGMPSYRIKDSCIKVQTQSSQVFELDLPFIPDFDHTLAFPNNWVSCFVCI